MDTTVNEIEQQQRSERALVRADADLFRDMMKHKAWPRYMALIETIAQNYHASIMKPIDNALESTKTEFAKGVLSGLSLATAIPNMKIKEAQELRRGSDDE